MKFKVLLAGLLTLHPCLTILAQSVWVAEPNAPNPNDAFGVDPSSPQANSLWGMFTIYSGMGSQSHRVFRTKDNGQTWDYIYVASGVSGIGSNPSRGTAAFGFYALDAETAWVGIGDMQTRQLSLLRTTAGPNSFTVIAAVLPADIGNLYFFNSTTGVSILHARGSNRWVIYRTTDGGASWTEVPNTLPIAAPADELIQPRIAQRGTRLWLPTTRGAVLSTTDMGLTWSATTTNIPLWGVAFRDAQHGLGYGFDNGISALVRTSDGGLTWTPVAVPSVLRTGTIAAIPDSPGTYIAAGQWQFGSDANFSVSNDDGTTWRTISNEQQRYNWLIPSSSGTIWLVNSYTGAPPSGAPLIKRYAGPALITATAPAKRLALRMYPNPTTGLVELPSAAVGNETVGLYDLAGRQLQTVELVRGQRQLDLSGQAAGTYQVVLTDANGQRYTQKLVRTAD